MPRSPLLAIAGLVVLVWAAGPSAAAMSSSSATIESMGGSLLYTAEQHRFMSPDKSLNVTLGWMYAQLTQVVALAAELQTNYTRLQSDFSSYKAMVAANYIKKTDAAAMYQPLVTGSPCTDGQVVTAIAANGAVTCSDKFLTTADASTTYLSKADASSTYLSRTDADTNFHPKIAGGDCSSGQVVASIVDGTATCSDKFLLSDTASSTYLSQDDASTTYLTQTSAATTYLTIADASSTYHPKLTGGSCSSSEVVASIVGSTVTCTPDYLKTATANTLFSPKLSGGLCSSKQVVSSIGTNGQVTCSNDFLTSADATAKYQPLLTASTCGTDEVVTAISATTGSVTCSNKFLTSALATTTYLSQNDATTTYLKKVDAASTYSPIITGGSCSAGQVVTGVTSVGVATCSSGFQKELPTTCPRGLVSVMVDGSVTCYNEKRLAFSGWNFISANGKDSCGLWSATGPTAETSGCMDMEFINGGVQMYTGELPGDSFNFQVTGNFNLPAGKYDLYCAADDQCGILFAGTNKVGTGITADCGACRDCNGKSAIVDIPAGAQDVSLVFCENSGGAWGRFHIQYMGTSADSIQFAPQELSTTTDRCQYWTRVGKLFQDCANEGISGGELSLSGSSPATDDDFDQFWTAQVLMRSGQYEFSCSADDACSIELDGQIMIGSSVCGFCASCTKTSATQSIIGGVYSVRLHFCEAKGGNSWAFNIKRTGDYNYKA